MPIRLATPDDLSAIERIFRAVAESSAATFAIHADDQEAWQRSYAETSGMYPWLVSEDAGEVIGFAKAGPFRSRDAYAYTVEASVFVDEAHRGKGAGKALLRRLTSTLHMQGYYTVIGVTSLGNDASDRLMRTVGMTERGTIEKAGWKFDRWHGVRIYEMSLQDDHQTPSDLLPVSSVSM